MSFSITFELKIACPALDSIAKSLERLSLAAAHKAGWPVPPNPTVAPSVRSGVETVGKIQVIFTPVNVEAESFSDAEKAEITQFSLTPVFGGTDQEPIVRDKTDLSEIVVEVDEGVSVSGKWAWIDNAGNRSLNPLVTQVVLAADVTPPRDPGITPGIRVGDEVA